MNGWVFLILVIFAFIGTVLLMRWADGNPFPRLLFPSCVFCKKSKREICYICQPGYSGDHHYYYHNKCLQSVLKDPLSFPHYIDRAKTIQQLEKEKEASAMDISMKKSERDKLVKLYKEK